jgi:hypothetical protein
MPLELTLPLLYSFLKDGWALARGRRRAISGSEVLRLREKWQPPFEDYLVRRRREGLRQDVIVRDVKRIDNYPEVEATENGISPWFRVGLAGTYHRGIKLLLSLEGLCLDKSTGQWRYSDYKSGEAQELTAALIGLVRYEAIESVNWDGDEFYGYPHIYCHFTEKGRKPYERLIFCEMLTTRGFTHYREVAELDKVVRLSKKLGVGHDA